MRYLGRRNQCDQQVMPSIVKSRSGACHMTATVGVFGKLPLAVIRLQMSAQVIRQPLVPIHIKQGAGSNKSRGCVKTIGTLSE